MKKLLIASCILMATGCSSVIEKTIAFSEQTMAANAKVEADYQRDLKENDLMLNKGLRDILTLSLSRSLSKLQKQPEYLTLQKGNWTKPRIIPAEIEAYKTFLEVEGFNIDELKDQSALIKNAMQSAILEVGDQPITNLISQMAFTEPSKIAGYRFGMNTVNAFKASYEDTMIDIYAAKIDKALNTSDFNAIEQAFNSTYQSLRLENKPEIDLRMHFAEESVRILLNMMGTEEAKIRKNPAQTGNSLIISTIQNRPVEKKEPLLQFGG